MIKLLIYSIALISTSVFANNADIKLNANIENGCLLSVSNDKVNFNSADYPVRKDTLGGKFKTVDLNIICSKSTRFKVDIKDIDSTSTNQYFNLRNNDDSSKIQYTVSSFGSLIYGKYIIETSSGKLRTFPLDISITVSPYNPANGNYYGGFELILTY